MTIETFFVEKYRLWASNQHRPVTILKTGDFTNTKTDVPLLVRPLGQGQRAYAFCATQPGQTATSITDEPRFHVRIEYEDILGNNYVHPFKKIGNRQ